MLTVIPNKWLFLDLNSYFASVEQQCAPELRGRPIAVVPMETDFTCAIAASYEAKAYGVRTGTMVRDAKRMCPGLVCVLARHDIYRDYHDRVIEETIRHVPINKVWSIDELASRLPERLRDRDAAIAVAHRLKDGMRQRVGEVIRCSIGIAPNSFLAKVATDMQKPDGLVVLEPDTMRDRLFALKLTDLPGINVKMEARLKQGGVRTVENLWNLSPKHARKIWGGVGGERFWYNLHGYDIPDQQTSTGSIGHSRMLDMDLRAPAKARDVARRLTMKAASRLRRYEFFAGCFQLSVRTTDDQRWSAEITLAPAQDNYAFLTALDGLWAQMLIDLMPERLKKVSITLLNLRRQQEITGDLFDLPRKESHQQREREIVLTGVMDRINKKFGSESIRLGISPKTSAGFVGTKIAFSRVPDREEFVE